jgi:phage terminase large subunit
MAFEVLKTRLGRWMNKEYNIKKKILCTFNPRKTWVDTFFYRPYKKKEESEESKFIFALAKDNPHLPEDYIKTLENLKDKATKERLLYGNFDYDDDPTSLISFDKIEGSYKFN